MNHKIKFGLYGVLLVAAIAFGILFYSSYHNAIPAEEIVNVPTTNHVVSVTTNQTTVTNAPVDQSVSTNTESTAALIATNAATNVVAAVTNVSTNVPAAAQNERASVPVAREPTTGRGNMIGYLVAFLGTAVLLGLLVARDLSEYFGSHSVEFLLNDEGTGIKNPEYEEAEQEWANGHHLEAIRMMRDYLTKYPREQYVALRIAEIYEKDLKNNLAAALEYEQILKHKLPPDRWGWAAIHLCNLYSKLGKTDDAVALLRRIVAEYGQTPAAEKARKRLATFETVGEEDLEADLPESAQSAPPPKVRKVEPEPPSNLPPGFRPKK